MTSDRTDLPAATPLSFVFHWLAPAAVVLGWLAAAGGTVYSTAVRENYDSCGQPADLPAKAGFFLGGIAMALAAVGFGMAMWLRKRNAWPPATAVVVAAMVLAPVGALLAGWVFFAHFRICF